MGPFMVEIVLCRVTRRGRKKMKGMNKLARENMRNDGPCFQFLPPEDTVKVTLDLSENGPVFSALDDMMLRMIDEENNERKKSKGASDDAKKSLKRLLKSGIPGVEKMFAPPPDPANPAAKKNTKGFHKMTDGSKQKFMKAIFGEDGTSIDAGTAAALLAATCSGGDPEIGENIAQILLPELHDKVDQTMMAALMASSSMINAGATTEEVMKVMKAELASVGLSEEEILDKTQKLMKVYRREESSSMAEYSLASKQNNVALKKNGTSPKDFTQAVIIQKAIGACGTTPENVAKVMMIQNQLSKRGAQSRHIAEAMKHQADYEGKRTETIDKITKVFTEDKLKKDDVFNNVRMAQALENENEPSWKEVRAMKDILQGCSPNSPEAIELNLTRAVKTAGLKSGDIAAALVAQKALASLNVDPRVLAQILNVERMIADNGVPSVEIARVLADGAMPKELFDTLAQQMLESLPKDLNEQDVDALLKVYDNLRLKANMPLEVIDDIDKNLIQVRCSLEDVADNMVSSQLARGEKEHMVIRGLCETLAKTGASAEIIATTMMAALKKVLASKSECELIKDIGRTLFEQGIRGDDLTKAITEIVLNLLDENIELREEAAKAMELVLKEAGGFPDQIRKLLQEVLPPEPPRPMSPRLAAELERLRAAEEAREAEKARKAEEGNESDGSFDEDEPDAGQQKPKRIKKPKNPAVEMILSDSRRGSLSLSRRGSAQRSRCGSISLGGVERQGSFYSEDVSKRSTVAVVVDCPQSKKQMEEALKDVFDGEAQNGHANGNQAIDIASILQQFSSITNDPSQEHTTETYDQSNRSSDVFNQQQLTDNQLHMDSVADEKCNLSLSGMKNDSQLALKQVDREVIEETKLSQMMLDFERGLATSESEFPDDSIKKIQSGNIFQSNSITQNVPSQAEVSQTALEAVLAAQKSLPPGAAQNLQAVLQAILKAGGTAASDISPQVLETILQAQKSLPPGMAENPQAVMQAFKKAQSDSAALLPTDILESIISVQNSLPAGVAQNTQAVIQAIMKSQGSAKNVPPHILEAIINAQKNLPPGQAQNPQALMQAISLKTTTSQNPAAQIPPNVVEFILKTQRSLSGDEAQSPEAILRTLRENFANVPGVASLSPQMLQALVQAQQNLPPHLAQNPQALVQAVSAPAPPTADLTALSKVSQNTLDLIVKAQKSLPANVANNPQAIFQAVLKAGGSPADIPPSVLEAILSAQKSLPPNTPLTSQSIVQATVAKSVSNMASNPALQTALKAQAEAVRSITPDILQIILKAQQNLPDGSAQDHQSLLKALSLAGGAAANIPPAVLAAVLGAQRSLPPGSSHSAASILESVKKVEEALTSGSTSDIPPAILQSMVLSLPPSVQSSVMNPHITNGQDYDSSNYSQINGPRNISYDSNYRFNYGGIGGENGAGGALADSLKENADKLQSLFASLSQSDSGASQAAIASFHLSTVDGKISDDDVAKLLSVFKTSGVISDIGGITKFRTIHDLKDTIEETNSAFDNAINQAKNRPKVGISDENRKLMEDILKKKLLDQQDINSRVSMLLAGSSLTTTSGVKQRRGSMKELSYDMLVTGGSDKYRRRTDDYNDDATAAARAAADRLSALTAQARASGLDRSIKRTSLARLRRLSEASEQKRKDEEEKRRIIGLRRAKVPLMVYSCGGFTRCFRIARYHVAEGPPIGVTYDNGDQKE